MELTAAIEGLAAIPGRRRVRLHSDSAYVVNCFRDRWWERWERNGWLGTARKPVTNRDLWERLLAETRRHDVVWVKVAGHSGEALNERVDALARAAITALRRPPRGGVAYTQDAPEKAGRSPAAVTRREESPGSAGQGAG